MSDLSINLDPQRAHYELEKKLASKLKNAPREARRELYSEVYDELYRSLPQHPGHVQKRSAEATAAAVRNQLRFLDPFIRPGITFVEVGAGDCSMTRAIAPRVEKAVAIEVSAEIANGESSPQNMELIITDGLAIPVPTGSAQVIYSNQLMEHLHPDDAIEQLRNVYNALGPGGVYVFMTPNRLNGPHDVSANFDNEATCFHLKEYTITELAKLLRETGFKRTNMFISLRVRVIQLPVAAVRPLEAILSWLPRSWSKAISVRQPVQQLLGIRLVSYK